MKTKPKTTPTNFVRAATLAPDTFNAEANTVEVVLSTGADVQRAGYVERLPIANADLRGIEGAPVLDTHNTGSTRAVIGVIEKAWKAEGEIRALIKLSSRDDVAGIVSDVRAGIIRNISIGYSVTKWRDENSKGQRTRTALAWSIHEASFVPIGADAGAVTRSTTVKKTQKAGANPATEDDNDEPTVAETRAEIRNVFRRALPNDLTRAATEADAIIDDDGTLEQAQARAYTLMQERNAAVPRTRVLNSGAGAPVAIELRAQGFGMRYLGMKGTDEARPYANLSAEEQGRAMLEECGVNTRAMTRHELLNALFTRAGMHSQSDFPLMLDIALGHSVRAAYTAAISPAVALLTIKRTAPDFSEQRIHQLGELPKLPEVKETGEVKQLTRGEARQTWRNKTYGGIFSASRQLIMGDAFGQLADFTRDAGQSAAATVADLVVSAFTESNGQGVVMGDGVRLFHAIHLNVGGGEIDLNAVSQGRVMLLTQTGIDGETIIDVRPDTLLVPPSLLTLAEQFCTTIAATTTEGVNPLASKLTPVCEPRLEAVDSEAWYLVDSRNPPLVLGGLTGFEGPQVSARDGWEVLGREWRVTLDAGVGPHDFRGAYRSAGGTG